MVDTDQPRVAFWAERQSSTTSVHPARPETAPEVCRRPQQKEEKEDSGESGLHRVDTAGAARGRWESIRTSLVSPSDCFQSLQGQWHKTQGQRLKIFRTFLLGCAGAALGFTVGLRGPAFLDLQIITGTDVKAASFFFMANSAGNLVGSLVVGVLYDRLPRGAGQRLLLLCLGGMGVMTVLLPWCAFYGLMVAAHFALALFAGGLDTVTNAELFHMWGKEVETAMQFLHFSFAFGGIVSPLVISPFLTPNPDGKEDERLNITPPENVTTLKSTAETSPGHPTTTKIYYAYLVSGLLSFLVAVPIAVETFRRCRVKGKEAEKEKSKVTQPLPRRLFLMVTFIMCVFYFIYNCIDDTFASLLATFTVKQLLWSKSDGARLSAVFWAAFAAGRFASIFVVRHLSPAQLILVCCTSLAASMLAFLLLARYQVDVGIWLCTALAALAMGPAFATGFTWMEQELVRVTGRVVSAVMVASSVGNMVNPVLTGFLLQELSPMWFCYVLLAESVVCLLIFLALLFTARCYIAKKYNTNSSTEMVVHIPTVAESTRL